jgi:hypothetical protein
MKEIHGCSVKHGNTRIRGSTHKRRVQARFVSIKSESEIFLVAALGACPRPRSGASLREKPFGWILGVEFMHAVKSRMVQIEPVGSK